MLLCVALGGVAAVAEEVQKPIDDQDLYGLVGTPRHLQYDDGPIVPMEEYDNEATPGYRVLDCFECFQAKGKMCIDRKYQSMFLKTKSSHEARGICCKPSNTTGYCSPTHPELACSMNSYDDDPDSKYKAVLSEGFRNY